MTTEYQDFICVGQIAKPVGIKGQIKIHPYTTSPTFFLEYNSFFVSNNELKLIEIVLYKAFINSKNEIISFIKGQTSRNEMELLRLKKIFIDKKDLPKLNTDEYYFADFAGLSVLDSAQKIIGTIVCAQDFGAGVFLDIILSNKKLATIPFQGIYIIDIDLQAKQVQIDEKYLIVT